MVQLPPSSLLNKKKGKASFNIKPLILCIPMLTMGVINDARALNLDIRQHWVRDYLDFGQNKGIFKPGATGLVLTRKDGTKLELPNVPFPDFGVVSRGGATTSIGGAYVITAKHNYIISKYGESWAEAVRKQKWGSSIYDMHGKLDATGSRGDFAVGRVNKFVVETQGATTGYIANLSDKDFRERYGVMVNGQKKVLIYRAGSGYFAMTDNNGTEKHDGVKWVPEMLGGSIFAFDHIRQKDGTIGAVNVFGSFLNQTTGGDSGSGAFVWDNLEKKWVVLGTLLGIASGGKTDVFIYNPWHQQTVDAFKERFTHKIELAQKELTFSATDKQSYSIDNTNTTFERNKDLSFSGGGTLKLSQNLDLGIGGLIFDADKKYTVTGEGLRYKGAGIDIGKNTVVDWHIKGMAGDDLHKIGAGTLNIHTKQENNLKIGNGTVVLKAEKAFNSIYLASGAATVKLEHANALDSSHKVSGIFFGNRGGTLDLNGYDQTFKRIAADDNGAIVTNTSKTKSTVKFDVPTWEYAYHGQFTGNLDVRHENDLTDPKKPKEKAFLALDGGMNIDGDVSVKNAILTFQGMPTTHAVFKDKSTVLGDNDWHEDIKNKENKTNQELGTSYMSNNQANAFEQPDWETRTYAFKSLKLDNATVNVGRNAWIIGDIEATNSSLQFGNVKVYRDQFAGNNVTGFDMQQKLLNGYAGGEGTIYYEGDISAAGSTITSYMNLLSASLNFAQGYLQKKKLVFTGNKGQNLPDFGLYY